MKTYMFYDKVTGEDFAVEEKDRDTAIKVAEEYFDKPVCTGEADPEWVEMLGIDTY